ncbi:MAG: beta-lactamase family protein [Ruminococcaceae bacterium]|nr:beta-lactamase family protein [Oscillospiraceae bacterium]
MLEKLDSLLDSFAGIGVPSFDCLVYHHGKPVYRRMHGFSDYEKQTPICGNERYFIYSCSKPITVTAALTLYEKKLFDLDDKLSDYLPEFANMTVRDGDTVRPAEGAITIRQLFTMTAGFTYNLGSANLKDGIAATGGKALTREMMKYLAKDPLAFDPGARFEYSLCHDVLAALVEVLSGMKFGDYVKKNIFDPLGMKDSTFCLPVSDYDTLCAQYRSMRRQRNLKTSDEKTAIFWARTMPAAARAVYPRWRITSDSSKPIAPTRFSARRPSGS